MNNRDEVLEAHMEYREVSADKVNAARLMIWRECWPIAQAAAKNNPTAGWQPIETAPRDKTRVALLRVDGNACRYGTGWYMPMDGWRGWDAESPDRQPTHWMPLPQPPISTAAKDQP